MTITQDPMRQELGNFSSLVCLKAIVTGVEDALGEKAATIAMVAAGRQRGKKLAEDLELVGQGKAMSLEEAHKQVAEALGKEGTRLCIIDKMTKVGEDYQVYAKETVCSAGEEQGSERKCTYTMGAIQGFLEAFLNKRLRGEQIGSVLRGDSHDILQYTVIQ